MIHLALAVGLVIAITLFVQHQRDRRAVRRTWEMLHPPEPRQPKPPPVMWRPIPRPFFNDHSTLIGAAAVGAACILGIVVKTTLWP
jgi:hypothetical protein